MNQIPNIEETYNTREIEEMMDKFLDAEIKWVDIDNGLGKYMLASQVIEQAHKVFTEYQESLHHQLQKAREEAQERCKFIIKEQIKALQDRNLGHEYYLEGLKMAVHLIYLDQTEGFEEPDHSELDQDKK